MSKLGYIHSSYGKQYNVAVANTYSNNILSGSNLPKNSLIISSPYDDRLEEDLGIYSLLATDSEGNSVRLTYCIKEGNGLIYNPSIDALQLSIDDKSIISDNGKLKVNISYFINNDTIKIHDGKLYIETENLRIASKDEFGISKIDDNTIKLDDDTIYVNTTSLEKANNSTSQYGIGQGDEETISSNFGKFSAITKNLRIAEGETPGIAKADEITLSLNGGLLHANTENLEKGIANKYGIVKGDEETIKVQNDVLSVITENLRKSSESNFGTAKIDGRTILLNEEGQIYMNSYDELISKIDTYKELKEKYDKKIEDIREEIKNSPYEFNRKDIYLFSVNKTSMTELNKPKHMEEIIEMPEQYVIAEFNIITGCDFYISVNYDRFTNEFPPVTLVNINYNDEVEYPNSEGLGINTVYSSTEGIEKKLILTFWAKNYNNSARDRSLITTIDVTVSSIEDIGMKKTERYSVVRYNSNYELPPEEKPKEEEERYIISNNPDETYIIDDEGYKYSLDDIIPWYVNSVSLYVVGRNSKTNEVRKLVDGETYSLFDYSSKAWQGHPGQLSNSQDTFYNDINISISTPVTINDRLTVTAQVIQIKKEVFPPNMVEQLTASDKELVLYTYNAQYIKIRERVFSDLVLNNFNIVNGVIQDKISNYSSDTHKGPEIYPDNIGVTYVAGIQPKIETSGYYSIPITFTGNVDKPTATPFMIKHVENNISLPPIENEDHDDLLDCSFYNVISNTLDLTIDSKVKDIEQTYGTNISNLSVFIKGSYTVNNEVEKPITNIPAPGYVPKIYFNINNTYTNNVQFNTYLYNVSVEDEETLGYNLVNITPRENIYLNHVYKDSNWEISYNCVAYYSYYGGLVSDLSTESERKLNTKFNINISIKSEPYLTVSNLVLNSIKDADDNIINMTVSKNNSNINVIQTYTINGNTPESTMMTDGEFLLTYKYYIKSDLVGEPTINLVETRYNIINDNYTVIDDYKYIYTITPPRKYYDNPNISTDKYFITYTNYKYSDAIASNGAWKKEYETSFGEYNENYMIKKEWHKYEIIGIDKQLSYLSINKGDILEAYFTDVSIQKPSGKVYAYAYSVITSNLFDENQIYSINTDANNYIYLLSDIQNYYLPANSKQNINPSNKVEIKVENINNLQKEKTIKVNSYVSEVIENVYTITEDKLNDNTTPEDLENIAKYNLQIINNNLPSAIYSTLIYIYNNPSEFSVNNHQINKSITFDYEVDPSNSPNVFYIFTKNADNIYTTYRPLSYYVSQFSGDARKNAINSEYKENNTLWKTLKMLIVSPRTIDAICKKGEENRIGTTIVNIPFLDEIGLWDELFCPNAGGTTFKFNTNLIAIKLEKGGSSSKYSLSVNRADIESKIELAVKTHVGYSTEENIDTLIRNMSLGKKNTFDFTEEDLPYPGAESATPIYNDDECSVAQAYANLWKSIYNDLSTFLDENGNIILPPEPSQSAPQTEWDIYNQKLEKIQKLEQLFKDTFANDSLIDLIFNQQNEHQDRYKFSQYNNDNDGYNYSLFYKDVNGVSPEYKFKYYTYDQDTGEEIEATDPINIDEFVRLINLNNDSTNYQETIIDRLYDDDPDNLKSLFKTEYPDGFRTFELYYNLFMNGYNIFNSAYSFKTSHPADYYLMIMNGIPATQEDELEAITGYRNISEYNSCDFGNAMYDNSSYPIDTLAVMNTIYYSLISSNNDLLRALYNGSEKIYYPAYYYINVKDSILKKNKDFIQTTLSCTINENGLNNYTYQYTNEKYNVNLFKLNIDEQILNEYNSLNLEDSSCTTLQDMPNNFFNNLIFRLAKPSSSSEYYNLLNAKYRYVNYQNTEEYRNAFGASASNIDEQTRSKINFIQDVIQDLNEEYSEVESKMASNTSTLAALLINGGDETIIYPKNTYDIIIGAFNESYSGTGNYFTVTWRIDEYHYYSTVDCTHYYHEHTGENNEVIVDYDYWVYNPDSVSDYYSSALNKILSAKATLEEKINSLHGNLNEFTAQQNNVLNTYSQLKAEYNEAYRIFFEKISGYSSIKAAGGAELETYFSKINHEKDVISNKYSSLKIEYDNLLKAYIKQKILESYKKSVDYTNNVSFYNMTNKSTLEVVQNWQGSIIESYKQGALKEVDYVLSILENDLMNIKNTDLRILDTSNINLSSIDILDSTTVYHTDFEQFSNIVPKYKILNNSNILYLDNIINDITTDNNYFLKYNIDNNSRISESLSQIEINNHEIFTGTLRYINTVGNEYIHFYEYFGNYFVKEVISPVKLLDVYSISNGFSLEANTTNSDEKYYKVKYNEDSIPSSVTAEGYPKILYRKNLSIGDYDLSNELYTKTNNIQIDNDLTMLSLQKDYIVYDNLSLSQYVCGNRDFFVVDPEDLEKIPYYGNIMFTSQENISENYLKYIFDTINNMEYKLLDYNLYFASSNRLKSEVNLNISSNQNGVIGKPQFLNEIKIFTYIKDYYNENNSIPTQNSYTNNLIWKYCKNKSDNNNLSYFKLLNYQWIEPGISENNGG